MALENAEDYQTHAGKGVSAMVGGERVYVGSARWLGELGVSVDGTDAWADEQRQSGATVFFAAKDGRLLGGFALDWLFLFALFFTAV